MVVWLFQAHVNMREQPQAQTQLRFLLPKKKRIFFFVLFFLLLTTEKPEVVFVYSDPTYTTDAKFSVF